MAKGSNKTSGKAGDKTGTSTSNSPQPGGAAGTMDSHGAAARGGGTGLTALAGAMGLSGGASGGSSSATTGRQQGGAIEALKQDHRRVESLFTQFETAGDEDRKEELVAMICMELNIHARLEEEIFYPACREEIDDEDLMDEAQVEHDAAKFLIADLLRSSCDDPFYEAKVKALKEQVRHHVAEEEKAGEGVFAKAQAHRVDTPELAEELSERKQELQRRGMRLQPTRAVSFDIDLRELMGREPTGRQPMGREPRSRDEERGYRGRDERYGGREEQRYGEQRHGEGRYAEGRYGEDRRPQRFRENDQEQRGERGRGGWFGDPAGHARAARRGWEEHDDRDRREGSGSRGGHGGWYGDPEGHARAARRRREGEEDDRRDRDRGRWR